MNRLEKAILNGIYIGALIGLGLARDANAVSVTSEQTVEDGLSYRVRVMWMEIYRYPEDGEWLRAKPRRQVGVWHDSLLAGSIVVGAIAGGIMGYGYCRVFPEEPDPSP